VTFYFFVYFFSQAHVEIIPFDGFDT